MIFKLEVLETVTSTIDYLKDLLRKPSDIGSYIPAVLAKEQTSGRGKMGSNWLSPKGNLYLSFLLGQGYYFNNIKDVSILSLLSGLAVKRLINKYVANLGYNSCCKWANDVMLDGKKVAGILLELEKDSMNTNHLIVGIGVNLNLSVRNLSYDTVCLKNIVKEEIDVEVFAKELLEILSVYLIKFAEGKKQEIINEWKEDAYLYKQNIVVKIGDKIEQGIFHDINEDGYLYLKKNNDVKVITAGEIYRIN